MAIYHLEGKVISRSQGRSAVAAAAYRACERLSDERTGFNHDFTKKSPDLVQSAILLTEQAPKEFSERETLWNTVESTEKRKDAQLCREFNISLPLELTEAQSWDLAREFVQTEFVDRGMIADMAFHRGHKSQEGQPHLHVMLTMREVTHDGFGKKVRAWNDKSLLVHWRESWADKCNERFVQLGHDMRIDHRTLEAQGINLEPQTKIGPKAAEQHLVKLAEQQARARANGERLLKDPGIALKAITAQQSTFTHHDLARFINRHSADSEQFQHVTAVIKASPDLVKLGLDNQGRERFSTVEMVTIERTMVEKAETKARERHHPVSPLHQKQALQQRSLSTEQQATFEHLMKSGDVACAVGFAGTGKSYLLGAASQAWQEQGYSVVGMTLSGIAAQNLTESAGIKSHTIANRLINWENERERLTDKHIVVVDEAGMVASRQMAGILKEAHDAGAKVVLIGDPEQLQAIEAGAAFRAISERTGSVYLTEVRRQTQDWQKQATKDLALGDTTQALNAYHAHGHVRDFDNKHTAMSAAVQQWHQSQRQTPEKTQIILAHTRDDVRQLNELARGLRREQGELGSDHTIQTERGERHFATGDRIYFLRNDKDLGVKNGSLGTLERIEGHTLTVRLDSESPDKKSLITLSALDYNALDHGYAATIHKAQGVTVDQTHILASKGLDRHLTYVGLSRHREGVDVYYSREDFSTPAALNQTLSRERAKDVTLDYGERRGVFSADPKVTVQPTVSTPEPIEQPSTLPSFMAQMKAEYEARHGRPEPPEPLLKSDGFETSVKQADSTPEPIEQSSTLPSFMAQMKAEYEAHHDRPEPLLKSGGFEASMKASMERFVELEKPGEHDTTETREQALTEQALTMHQDPVAMAYLRENSPDIAEKVDKLAKEHEQQRSQQQQRTRGYDYPGLGS